jgi:hypothetical protein
MQTGFFSPLGGAAFGILPSQKARNRFAERNPLADRMSPRHGVKFVVEVDGEAHVCTMVQWCDDVKGGGFKFQVVQFQEKKRD